MSDSDGLCLYNLGEESQNMSKDARPVLPFLSECGLCLRSPLNGSFWRQRGLLALINCSYVPRTCRTPKQTAPGVQTHKTNKPDRKWKVPLSTSDSFVFWHSVSPTKFSCGSGNTDQRSTNYGPKAKSALQLLFTVLVKKVLLEYGK